MSDKRISAGSVAAFLFMPQFRQSFRNMAHIVPIFIRTLAMSFSAAGLVPRNHPSLRYGVEGVEKYGFGRLMGDAWFTLRTTRASISQWSVFCGIVLLIATTVSAVATFFLNIFFGFGSSAMAQIFTHPGTPYGATDDTGLDAVATLGTGQVALFDASVGEGFSSGDYALMVLDKVLRQGAVGTGGALQNAFGALMQVYNTGVLVVASIMIFWMIVTIVVDTAKTGVVGGGRHNMVWTPIRVIFALGIMIPLGASGFSSGQYMVMKLAEWGSNFASRAWMAYITEVTTGQSLLAPYSMANVTGLAHDVTKILVCQAAANTYISMATPDMMATNAIRPVMVENRVMGSETIIYTDGTSDKPVNRCGQITYDVPVSDASYLFAKWSGIALLSMGMGGINPGFGLAAAATEFATADPLRRAANKFKQDMRGTLKETLNDIGGEGNTIRAARDLACAITGRAFSMNSGGDFAANPVRNIPQCPGARIESCGATETEPPNANCVFSPTGGTGGIADTIVDAYNQRFSVASQGIEDYLTPNQGDNLLTKMRDRGWSSMGIWLHEISVLNALVAGARDSVASVEPGELWQIDCDETSSGGACDSDEYQKRIHQTMNYFNEWWDTKSTQVITDNLTRQQQAKLAATEMSGSAKGYTKKLKNKIKGSSLRDGDGLLKMLLRLVGMDGDGYFLFDTIDLQATNTYPLTQLAHAGHSLIKTATNIMATMTLVQAISTIEIKLLGFGGSLGSGLAGSQFMSTAFFLAMTLMMCGLMLAFYVPALPFIKVALAVLTWITSVFEAVVMVPIAALAHLSSEGEGLVGGARTCWILWLNVLLRPILVVIGFVGALLIFNSFAAFWNVTFTEGARAIASSASPVGQLLSKVVYSVVYLSVLYTAANTTFKLLDSVPDAMVRWLGGSPDKSFDNDEAGAMMMTASNVMKQTAPRFNKPGLTDKQKNALEDQKMKTQAAYNAQAMGGGSGPGPGSTP